MTGINRPRGLLGRMYLDAWDKENLGSFSNNAPKATHKGNPIIQYPREYETLEPPPYSLGQTIGMG